MQADQGRVRVAVHAMRCRFEVVLTGPDAPSLRAAGEEALAEISRLEAQLSRFLHDSELSRVNRTAAARPVELSRDLFDLLSSVGDWWLLSEGHFDPTISSPEPFPGGFRLIELDQENRTVFFRSFGLQIDLGAVAKGYALDRAAQVLKDAGVLNAFLHGGTSSSLGLGTPTGDSRWTVALGGPSDSGALRGTIQLRDLALGVSGNDRQAGASGGGGHVIDPLTGSEAVPCALAAVVDASAARADALSTALLCAGPAAPWLEQLEAAYWIDAAGFRKLI